MSHGWAATATTTGSAGGAAAAARRDDDQGAGERGVGAEQAGDAFGDPAGRRQVEELVRSVGVAAGYECTGDDELGGREAVAEHAHEGDRAALAERTGGLAERRRRRLVERS